MLARTWLITLGALGVLALAGCKDKAAAPAPGTGSAAPTTTTGTTAPAGDLYFTFTVDGKAMSIAPDDISTTFQTLSKTSVFKIFAGKEGGVQLLLTVPSAMTGPSHTPSGSTNYDLMITQGSVSLQDYPENGFTTNSFETTYPETSVSVPDAVVITSIEGTGKDGRIVTGTFSAKTFGTHGHTDPKDTDHTVVGKFRIHHDGTFE